MQQNIFDIKADRQPYNTILTLQPLVYEVYKKIYDTEILVGEVNELESGQFEVKINLSEEKILFLKEKIKKVVIEQNFGKINLN